MCDKAYPDALFGVARNQQAEKETYGTTNRPTLREEAEKRVGYHRSEADKQDRAVAFFRDNPAFDEFVRLVRSGAIQF